MNSDEFQSERLQLAEFQHRLLDLLDGDADLPETIASIQQLADTTKLDTALGEFDERMVDVAKELTSKWGVKKQHDHRDT